MLSGSSEQDITAFGITYGYKEKTRSVWTRKVVLPEGTTLVYQEKSREGAGRSDVIIGRKEMT